MRTCVHGRVHSSGVQKVTKFFCTDFTGQIYQSRREHRFLFFIYSVRNTFQKLCIFKNDIESFSQMNVGLICAASLSFLDCPGSSSFPVHMIQEWLKSETTVSHLLHLYVTFASCTFSTTCQPQHASKRSSTISL